MPDAAAANAGRDPVWMLRMGAPERAIKGIRSYAVLSGYLGIALLIPAQGILVPHKPHSDASNEFGEVT